MMRNDNMLTEVTVRKEESLSDYIVDDEISVDIDDVVYDKGDFHFFKDLINEEEINIKLCRMEVGTGMYIVGKKDEISDLGEVVIEKEMELHDEIRHMTHKKDFINNFKNAMNLAVLED